MMNRIVRYLSVAVAVAALVSLAAGCGTTAASSVPRELAPTAHAGFAGYKWSVTAIHHDRGTTAIPARYPVFIMFMSNGQFVANEPVNTHSGTYRAVSDGFVTSDIVTSLVGYIGHDPIVLLARSAISSFDTSAHATASLTGNRLTVVVGGYTLICQRDGTASESA
jgi:hypothetical protein